MSEQSECFKTFIALTPKQKNCKDMSEASFENKPK